jgi:hypothetical protein
VPDLGHIIAGYMESLIPADQFVEKLQVVPFVSSRNRLKTLLSPFIHFPHKCMYDKSSFIRNPERCGL